MGWWADRVDGARGGLSGVMFKSDGNDELPVVLRRLTLGIW